MNFANWPKKNKRRTFCFWKKNEICLKKFLCICRLQFRLPRPKSFRQRAEKSSLLVQTWEPKKTWPKRSFSSKYPNGHVECSFDIQARTVLTKHNLFFLQCATMTKKCNFFEKKSFFHRTFLWGCKIQFWQHHWQSFEKTWNKLVQNPKKIKKYKIFIISCSEHFSIQVECNFNDTVKKIDSWPKNLRSICDKNGDKEVFQRKTSPQKVSVDTKIAFSANLPEKFARKMMNIGKGPKTIKKVISLKKLKIPSESSHGRADCSYDYHV